VKIWILNPPFFKKYSRAQRSPAVTKSGTIYFPIWLAYCVGVLEKAGYSVTFTDAPASGFGLKEILRQAEALQPELIVMDTSTPSIENDIQIGEQIKKILPESFVVLVGTHVSALPEETLLKSDLIDAVARREYEYTIRELASVLDKKNLNSLKESSLNKIDGLSFKSNGRIIHNPDRPYIEKLDDLPWVSMIYKKYLKIGDYFNPNALYPMVTLLTSRGCPFHCSFCVYPQTFTGRRYRFRSIQDVVDEMKFIVKEFPEAKSIFFEDDTLTANKKRCLKFADAILEEGIEIPWEANSRSDLDLETMKKIKAAGCRELCVGFESGNQDILNSMRKGTKLERMYQFMKDAKKAGILIHGCFMVGFPGETLDDVKKTIDLAINLDPDTVQFYPIMVYPGTEAYEQYKKKGWLTSLDYSQWITPEGLHNCVVKNEVFDASDLVRLCDVARKRFYLRPRYMFYKFLQMLEKPSEIVRTAKAARVFFKHLLLGSKV